MRDSENISQGHPNSGNGEVVPLDFKVGVPAAPGKIIQADATGRIKHDPTAAAEAPVHQNYTVKPFPDGHVFKYTTNPAQRGTFVMFDCEQRPVAVVEHPAVANLLCNAARMLFEVAVAEQQRIEAEAKADETRKTEGA